MKKILLVTSSVREHRAADNILNLVKDQVSNRADFEVVVADLKDLTMPFFDAPVSPSSEDFKPTDEHVIAWTGMIKEADAVIFLVAEYNHSLTGVLKNAIDWVYREWMDKPVALIGYGWVGGARAIKHLHGIMASNISAKTLETEATLHFTKDITVDGSLIPEGSAIASIKTVLDELEATI